MSGARMKIEVQAKNAQLAFECGEDETILHAGLRQGLTLPYECATGTCGTCRARVMSGNVDLGWKVAPGLARLKQDKGDILMCQSRARGDCLLRVPSDITTVSGPCLPVRCRGVLRSLRRLTHDVIDFDLALSAPMMFEAGQFVVLETPAVVGGRAYSMVNFAPATDRLSFVVKRKPGGGFGDWLFESAAENAELKVFGPLGRAVFRVEENRNILCIAGGSGIAGMMAILERARQADYFRNHRGYVFFGVRTLADTFYLEHLAQYAAVSHGNLDVTIVLSHETAPSAAHDRYPVLHLASGFVHDAAAQAMAGRYDDVIAYIGGPPPMVEGALKVLIAQGGLTAQQIRYDKFS
jgi:toluene monooxygenase electron transfer component